MLGGLNLAWSALGAKVAEKQEKLIDGPSVAQASLALSLRSLQSRDLSIDLAGDHPVAVVGILLTHPQGGVLRDRLMQDFRIEASASAADDDFRPVLSGRMSVQVEPQPFVFPTPVEARRLRLIPLNNRSPDGIARGVVIGDFKAIGNPSQPLPDGRAINLVDPRLGGHVVYNRPTQSLDKLLLQTGKTASIHRPKDSRTAPPKIVIGFRDGRAAAIDGLAWMADKKGHANVTEVMIETSLASPFGPWTPLAQSWQLTLEGDSELRFKQPIWARYLRLTIAVPDGQARLLLPDQLRVFERPAGPDPARRQRRGHPLRR